MKKAHLFIIFLALSATLYVISEAYASIYHSTTATNLSQQPTRSTNDYQTSTPQPDQRTNGDPITDPRPKLSRRPVSV